MNGTSNLVPVDYTPNIFLPIFFLFLAFVCVLTNSTILLKLLFKPKLWTLVNLFLSLLLGKNYFLKVYTPYFMIVFSSFKYNLWNYRTVPTFPL